MKTRLLILIAILFFANSSKASHLFGGEITWKCLSSGQYEFTLKIYRDCNGAQHFPYASLSVYGHPTVCSIPLGAAVYNDISPSQCPTNCSTGGPGTVQEIIQVSNSITLSGVPPTSGWVFEVNGCCRNIMSNMGGGGQSFSIRSIMYPYNGLNTNPCFDSSPYFAERPVVFTCTGYPFSYNPNGIDPEKDSLVFEWANCLQTPTNAPCGIYNGAVILFSPPYFPQNPIPGVPTLHPKTGQLNFFVPDSPAIIGNYAMCYKVTAYKCGIKVAEVFRDCSITLINGCLVQGAAPNNINLPPVVTPPFNGSFADTVVAGDTIMFAIFASDFQSNIGGGFQNVTINASGENFGAGFTSDSTGCPFPPCATLTPPPPINTPIATQTIFKWVTSCANLVNCNSDKYNTHRFVFKVGDSYCPAPAYTFATVSITVIGPAIQHLLDSMWVNYPSATSYQWYFNNVLIPGATNSWYVGSVPGIYTCQIGTSTGCSFSTQPLNPFLSVNNFEVINTFEVVPNPATKNFSVKINASAFKSGELLFTDELGRIVYKRRIAINKGANTFDFEAESFTRGFYFVQLAGAENVLVKKLIIQ